MKKATLLLLLVASLASSAVAGAQPAPAPAPSAGWGLSQDRAKGLMLGGGFGVTGCTDDWCDSLDPLVYFRLQGLVRMFNYLGVGVHLGFNFHDPDSRYVDAVYDVFLGLEVRGFLPLGRLDLWTGLALGWTRRQGDGEVCNIGGCFQGSYWMDGFGFGWGVGALFYLTRSVALGLDFWLYKGAFNEECSDGDVVGRNCGDAPDGDLIGITWSVGVSAMWFLPF